MLVKLCIVSEVALLCFGANFSTRLRLSKIAVKRKALAGDDSAHSASSIEKSRVKPESSEFGGQAA